MNRYIDADRLKKHFEWWESEAKAKEFKEIFDEIIDAQPTADVVEVVRCKDCRFFDHSTDFTFCKRVEVGMDEDDYCSFAERRTDDDRNG